MEGPHRPAVAPKGPSFVPPFGRFEHTFSTIIILIVIYFLTLYFCTTRLIHSTVVPRVPWDARGYLIATQKRFADSNPEWDQPNVNPLL